MSSRKNSVWVAVNLTECRQNIVIPLRFVYEFNKSTSYNRRINRNHIYRVFYSANKEKKAAFHLNTRNKFSARDDACYHAKLLRCFGK